MRRLSRCIVIALSASILASVCSAQQTANNRPIESEQQGPPTLPPLRTLSGDGTINFIPIWTSPSNLLSSGIYQASSGNIGIGTTTPAAKLDVSGGVNAAQAYQIGGSDVLSIGIAANENLFLGISAGAGNGVGAGTSNVFSGYLAGYNNRGSGNVFSGNRAGYSNTAGEDNVFSGFDVGYSNTTGYENVFSGYAAGYNNTTGNNNTFAGTYAGYANSAGQSNAFFGSTAGLNNTTGSNNVFVGPEAGTSNNTGSNNTFSGYQAGYTNTTGHNNTFDGVQAGYSNRDGINNTFSGYQAGYYNISGYDNTFFGYGAGGGNANGDGSGHWNAFYGSSAGASNDTGVGNTFSGYYAGALNTSGSLNIFLGWFAGSSNTTGTQNIFLGGGGSNTTGSYDVYVANAGPNSGTESNTIRIGDNSEQTAAYIAGIYGVNVGGVPVQINSNGQLGAQTSALRFKEQVRDMGDSTSALMKLRPVTFFYRPEYANGDRTLQYGLIAEEVAKVYPELVAYDNEGQPYTVRYQYITTMLLNEVQKQYRRAETQAEIIERQQQKIDDLAQRLTRLESIISNQAQTVAQK